MPLKKIFSPTLSMSSDNYFILPLWKALLLSGPLTEKRHILVINEIIFKPYSNVDCYSNKNACEVKDKDILWGFMCSDFTEDCLCLSALGKSNNVRISQLNRYLKE